MIEIPIHHSSWKERIQAAFLFFTRIPLGRFFSPKREAYESAIEHWPLTGWITGLIMGTIIFFCSGILPGIAILLAITVRILITGCLHEDGLIRFLNGMGQRETGRKIVTETMKDHQSSTFGIVGIILYILLLWMTLNRMYPLQAALTVIAADPFCKMLSAQLTMMLPHAANPSNSQDEIAFRKLSTSSSFILFIEGCIPMAIVWILTIWGPLAHPTSEEAGILRSVGLPFAVLVVPGLVMYFLYYLLLKRLHGYNIHCLGAVFLLTELAFYATVFISQQINILQMASTYK